MKKNVVAMSNTKQFIYIFFQKQRKKKVIRLIAKID